jgi:hypothetical protein
MSSRYAVAMLMADRSRSVKSLLGLSVHGIILCCSSISGQVDCTQLYSSLLPCASSSLMVLTCRLVIPDVRDCTCRISLNLRLRSIMQHVLRWVPILACKQYNR